MILKLAKCSCALLFLLMFGSMHAQTKRAMTLEDVMKFHQIKEAKISEMGKWISYASKPDRGNWSLFIASTGSDKKYNVPNGSRGEFSKDEKFFYSFLEPDFFENEKAEKDKPRAGLELLNTQSGSVEKWKDVKAASFSRNSKWLALHLFEKKDTSKNAKPVKNIGSNLIVRNLDLSKNDTIKFVSTFSFDSLSSYLAYSVLDSAKKNNGLYFYNLVNGSRLAIDTAKNSVVENLLWNKQNILAYQKTFLKKDEKKDSSELKVWDNNKILLLLSSKDLTKDWYLPIENRISWSKDGLRLFFGIKPVVIKEEKEKKDSAKKDPYNFEPILAKREVDVWHWDDPIIKSHEKIEWKSKEKFTYSTLYDFQKKKIIYLTDEDYSRLTKNENPDFGILANEKDYQKLKTWDGDYYDLYSVSFKDGERNLVDKKLKDRFSLSPSGRFISYYKNRAWHLYNTKTKAIVNLTQKINVPFYDEENDTPEEPNSLGIAGWIKEDKYILINDMFDIWKVNTENGEYSCLTDGIGRKEKITFRIVDTDKEKEYFDFEEELLLTAFNNNTKTTTFYNANASKNGIKKLIEENKKFSFVTKAPGSDKIIFTKETYNEFPDLWISNINLSAPQKMTNLNGQLDHFYWGTSQLIEWTNLDGKKLQGAVILPGNYQKGKRYPVLVYYYEISSDRVHQFNEMVVNHRPNFPFYASNDYIIFLPDIKFDIGRPGYSATKCLLPGCQKLVDLGWADPKGFGLHGHSWGGYQSAFVVTQTDFFACAIAGAPVGNMTSAYSGIRWGTGLARQFQYEKSQSRIGGTLWEKPISYIENSPVFFADKINTPLLLMHGDEDDAVPWYQSIEIYLSMRRLEKDCIFLQYRGEPHHPKKYANKLDYSIKMKEYLDYYCKGLPAASWITKGSAYKGK